MSVPVHISRLAQLDVDAAAAWYEAQADGLGDDFRDRVGETFDKIALMPGLYSPGPKNTRTAPVKGFPYFVLYREESAAVTILAVYYGRRDPKSWQRRA